MDLNAAHYPDKAGAVARQWPPDWLDDKPRTFDRWAEAETAVGAIWWTQSTDFSSTGLPLWGHGRGWKWDAAEPHNGMFSSGSVIASYEYDSPCPSEQNTMKADDMLVLKESIETFSFKPWVLLGHLIV